MRKFFVFSVLQRWVWHLWQQNDKTPVMCACAYARRQVIIVILQFVFLQISNLFPTVVLWKTTRCFTRNDTLFYEERHVVLRRMTRCFTKKMLALFPDSERRYDECQMFRPKAICFPSSYGLSKAQCVKKDFSKDEKQRNSRYFSLFEREIVYLQL